MLLPMTSQRRFDKH